MSLSHFHPRSRFPKYSSLRWTSLRLSFVATSLIAQAPLLCAAEPSSAPATIAKVWAQEQQRVRSATFTWLDSITLSKETLENLQQGALSRKSVRSGPGHAQDTTLDESHTLIIGGDRWRYESDSHVFDGESGTFIPQRTLIVSSDGMGRTYMAKGTYAHPLGNINRLSKQEIPRDLTSRPLFLIYRSLACGLFDAKSYTISSTHGYVDKAACIILQATQRGPEKWALWVDPARAYSILRYTLSDDGTIVLQADINYRHNGRGTWVPTGWTIVQPDLRGQLKQSITSVVREAVINREVDRKHFELDFPPGTWVRDFTRPTGSGYYNTQFIAREGGEERLITDSERKAAVEKRISYEQLLSSESGQATAEGANPLLLPWIVIGCVMLLLSLTYLFIRRMMRRKTL